jgi:hypothetical protein
MGTISQNFIKWKGDNFIIQYTIEDATNLTGFKATWSLATSPSNSTRLITKTSGSGINFSTNYVYVTMSRTDTDQNNSEIPAGMYYHELQLINSEGLETVAAVGTLDLRDPIVKRT